MSFTLSLFGVGTLLTFIQLLAATPWLLAFGWEVVRKVVIQARGENPVLAANARSMIGVFALLVIGGALVPPTFLAVGLVQDRETLEWLGRIYASILQLQLLADLIVGIFLVILLAWPKGGAVALAAFREGVRQPMFWMLGLAAFLWMAIAPFLPYYTFGEDFVVVQELGYDTIMVACVAMGVLAASMSISEEIEGKTAITLMSKPVSRRQFLLGKFLGIFLVAIVLSGFLGWWFEWTLLCYRWFDRTNAPTLATPTVIVDVLNYLNYSTHSSDLLRGVGLWMTDTYSMLPGLAVALCQVMILLAIAVSLATRLPMQANLVICALVYIVGHLNPVLEQISARKDQNVAAGRLLKFTSQVFNIGLPGLEFFDISRALSMDMALPDLTFMSYIGKVCLYGLMYTAIALLFGLLLFEDRDLA